MSAPSRAGVIAGFALLAGYASLHWFALAADPPVGRWLICLAVAVALAVALSALPRLRLRRAALVALAALLVIAALAAGMLVTGVPARLLAPAGWDELRAQLDAGLAGVSQIDLPYSGPSDWTRLGILLAAPLTLALATAVAFWPARRPSGARRGIALALLVALYGVAVTWESPNAELLHGVGLLACIAAYLWLGRLPASRALAAGIAVAVAGLVALPAAARVDSKDPLIDYSDWRVFGNERTIAFDWNHSYGPLDWPQRGTELFEVRGADRPLYWKTSVLDEFNGFAWVRGDGVAGFAIDAANQVDLRGATDEMLAAREEWIEQLEVGVLALQSSVLVTTGTPQLIDGIDVASPALDGTTFVPGEGLTQGSEYGFSAYAPNPSARLLKRTDAKRYPRALESYTSVLLPQQFDQTGISPEAAPVSPLVPVTMPLRGSRAARSSGAYASMLELIRGTPYERVARLARSLTRDAGGNYQAVAAVERHLLENYIYEQQVPEHEDPLPQFLFADRRGYCQQFSGAMALMLRMAGIPSRVVSGFAPGLPDPDREGTYLVRDTDAHSWVEVWFPRVGWVTVDPTPSAAPARTETIQAGGVPGSATAFGIGRAASIEEAARSGPIDAALTRPGGDEDEGSPLRGLLSLLILAGIAAIVVVYRRRRRRLLSPEGAEPQVRELIRALPLVGVAPAPGLTLLGIERTLAGSLGPEAAEYSAALRANRYRRGTPLRPGPHERRLLRRALGRGRGLGGRLRALFAIPPGGPRTS